MFSSKISFFIAFNLLLILLSGCTKTEPSAIQKESFIKSFGGAYGNEAIDFIKDNGNYYILGNIIDDDENTHIFLAKTDEYGNRLWPKDLSYSIDNKQTIAAQIIKLKKQQGYAIIGSIEMDDSLLYYEPYLLIIDENGKIVTETTYQNPQFNDFGKCIAELENGGFTIPTLSDSIEGSKSKINLIPTDASGVLIRNPSVYDDATEVFQIYKSNINDEIYVAAYSTKPCILKINADGTSGGMIKYTIEGQIRSIAQDNTGNTFVCGIFTNGANGGNDGFIAKLSDIVEGSPTIDWLYEFGKSGADYLEQLVVTENNELLLTGSAEDSKLKTFDIWVLKTDIAGNYLSQMLIGGDNNEYGIRILETDNNKYVVEGTTYHEKNGLITIFKSELK